MKSEHIVVGIVADVDAGKTTLSENILFRTGTIRKAGRVDHGDTCLDTDAMERERGITIFSREAEFRVSEKAFTLLDTPGHADFSSETERVLSVLDYAILVISAPEGVRSHVQTIWKLLKQYAIPAIVFINKCDLYCGEKEELLKELNTGLEIGFHSFDCLDTEDVAMLSDEATETYLECGKLENEDLKRLIRERRLFPCYYGSALKGEGIAELLNGLVQLTDYKDYPEDFSGRIFKITRDKTDRLSHMKITGGTLHVKDLIGDEKIEQIRLYSGDSLKQVQEASAGMIVSITGLSQSYAGQGIGEETGSVIPVLVPLFSMTVIPTYDVTNAELYSTLKLLEEEIPEISVDPYSGKGDVRIRLMGPVQTQVISRIMEERFQMPVRFENNRIVYRETVTEISEGVGHFEPLRHYAEVHLRLEPAETGSGLIYQTELSEDLLPGNYQRLILSQLEYKRHRGILTGAFLTDVKITLVAGKHHVKHTVGGDFREAGCRAVRHGLMKNVCKLLEPWYSFEIRLPQIYAGRAMSDITCKLNGNFEGPVLKGDTAILNGKAPVSLIQNYQSELTAYTKGYGKLSLVFCGYSDCHNSEEVIENVNYDAEADLKNPCGSVFCEHGAGEYVGWRDVESKMHLPLVCGQESRGRIPMQTEKGVPASNASAAEQNAGKRTSDYLGAGLREDRELEKIFLASLGKNRKEDSSDRNRKKRILKSYENVSIPEPKKNYLLVDGYNIIHAWNDLRELGAMDLNAARTALLEILSNYQGFRGTTLITVFDAYRVQGGKGSIEKYHNIYCVYTKEAQTADAYIEKTVHELAKDNNVTVATSDGLEQIIVFGDGAVRMSARELYDEVKKCSTDIEETCRRIMPKLKNGISVGFQKPDNTENKKTDEISGTV